MKRKMFVLFFSIVILGCTLKKNNEITVSDSSNQGFLPDSLSDFPWAFEEKIKYLDIPDSMSRNKIEGSAILHFTINREGKLVDIQIARLILRQNGKTLQCSLFTENDETSDECKQLLDRYHRFFYDFFDNLRIVRNPNSRQPESENRFGLSVKLIKS